MFAVHHSCILASGVNSSGLIDPEQFLVQCLRGNQGGRLIEHRACHECASIFQKTSDRFSTLAVFELLPLEVTEYYSLRGVNRTWYEAGNIFFSRFREIQDNLPNHQFTAVERRILRHNLHLILGHNQLICQYIKSMPWEQLTSSAVNYHLKLIASTEQTCACWGLMCGRECKKVLTDSEAIDILLHVKFPPVREYVLGCLTRDPYVLACYVPILCYAIRLDEDTLRKERDFYTVRDHLISLSLIDETIRHKFFWELSVQLEEPQYNTVYRQTSDLLQDMIGDKLAKVPWMTYSMG